MDRTRPEKVDPAKDGLFDGHTGQEKVLVVFFGPPPKRLIL